MENDKQRKVLAMQHHPSLYCCLFFIFHILFMCRVEIEPTHLLLWVLLQYMDAYKILFTILFVHNVLLLFARVCAHGVIILSTTSCERDVKHMSYYYFSCCQREICNEQIYRAFFNVIADI